MGGVTPVPRGRATAPLVRPFRTQSEMAEGPKALPWAAIGLPLWGVKDDTTSRWKLHLDQRGSWPELASNFWRPRLSLNPAC